MVNQRLGNYLRAKRKAAGLSQRAVAALLGFESEAQVSRYERNKTVPSLVTALAYEVLFRTPVSELFPGVEETIHADIESKLHRLEAALEEANGERAVPIERILQWIKVRQHNNPTTNA
jgi:transcriptional regulator with XRE-family HTH domain